MRSRGYLAALAGLIGLLVSASAADAASLNLIVNGGPQAGLCSSSGYEDMSNPGWTISSGAPEEVCLKNTGHFPDAATPGVHPGAFFAGGTHGDGSLTQTVSVAAGRSQIDDGRATFSLSGWFGGYGAQNNRAALIATFLNAAGTALTSRQIGPVTNTDRHDVTSFLPRRATGQVPAGTRAIRLQLDFIWTSSEVTNGYAQDLSLTINSDRVAPAPLTPPVSTVPHFDHVFLVFMENENFSRTSNPVDGGEGIIGNLNAAPYINALAARNSLLTNYSALTHYSDPNYFGLAGGSTFGHTGGYGGLESNCVQTCVFHTPSLADRVEAVAETWKEYEDGANGNCDTTTHGYYYPDDAPFLYFAKMRADRAYCEAHMQPLTAMFSDLRSAVTTPDFSWFAADDCFDMESCGIAAGDGWLSSTLPHIFDSPAWRDQRSLLIVTWDEDGNGGTGWFGDGQTNRVATIVVGSQNTVKHGFESAVRYDHYSTARTIEAALGLAPLTDNDRYATPINDVFTP